MYACRLAPSTTVQINEESGNVIFMAKRTHIHCEKFEHTERIMNKKGAHNSKTQRLNTVTSLVDILVVICLYE